MPACFRPASARVTMITRAAALAATLLAVALLLAACADATSPADREAANTLDPGSGSFTLKDIVVPDPSGRLMMLRLEGADLQADPATGLVTFAVAVRNLSGDAAVATPLIVWVRGLQPADIVPVGADLTRPTGAPGDSLAWGYDYSSLQETGSLPPGAATPPRTWTFADPGLAAFSFAAAIEVGPEAPRALLGGVCFVDTDRDGQRDDGEPPFTAGGVSVSGPDGTASFAPIGPDGRWETPIKAVGLYEVSFQSLAMTPLPVQTTTPNPLHVVITPGPDGAPQSWLGANFGLAPFPLPPVPDGSVTFTDLPPSALHKEPWSFLGVRAEGSDLVLHVGFSGCGPDHDFSLLMSGGFHDAFGTGHADLTLVHETVEMCDAYFTKELRFDVAPMFQRYLQHYGAPGPLVVTLHGPDGFAVDFILAVALPDSIRPM